jgi:hypothetical protein
VSALTFAIRVIDALERLAVPYMAVGSFSSNVYGIPRATKDVDVVVDLGEASIGTLAAEIGDDFVLDPQMSFESITGTMRYRITHRGEAFLVEIFLLSEDPHDQARFQRRVTRKIGERTAFVPRAEDVIITKLRWSRQGQRQKDIEDVKDVLSVQAGKLDHDYIRNWCDQHGTRELFERLLRESSV